MKFSDYVNLFEGIEHSAETNTPLGEVYRVGSDSYYKIFREARRLYTEGKITLSETDQKLVLETDIGEFAEYEGKMVPLDSPFEEPLTEAKYQGKTVELNKPKRGGSKKYYVYVKDPKTGNVKKVSFGAKDGGGSLAVKIRDPKRRKAFADRHNCAQKKDKTKASYWSCRLPRYAKSLGLSGGGSGYW